VCVCVCVLFASLRVDAVTSYTKGNELQCNCECKKCKLSDANPDAFISVVTADRLSPTQYAIPRV